MDIQQLRYFKTVATTEKIAEAAEQLFISAPALSTSISRLEKELGVKLFDRAGNRITLNQQGQIFLKHTNHILFSLESSKQEIRQSLAMQGHNINVISTNSLVWVDLIAAFSSEYPAYTLACSNTSIGKLAENGFTTHHTFLFAYDIEVPSSFQHELNHIPLFQFCPTVMLHKDHPLAQESRIHPSQLRDEKLFLSHPHYALNMRVTELLEMYEIPYLTDTYYSHVVRQKMVSQNLGISFATQNHTHLFCENVVYRPLEDPFEKSYARLYWRKDHVLAEHEKEFLSFIEQFYSDLH